MGALVSKEHLAKVTGYVKLAKQEGGTIACGEGVDSPIQLPDKNKAVRVRYGDGNDCGLMMSCVWRDIS